LSAKPRMYTLVHGEAEAAHIACTNNFSNSNTEQSFEGAPLKKCL